MSYRKAALMVLLIVWVPCALAATPIDISMSEVRKIWDKAPHNAFTDLLRWNEQFYCAFREGRGHVSTDGRIRVISSQDGDSWQSATLVELEGYDLRDAHLSVTPDRQLMLIGGAAPRKKDNQSAPTGTFASFSRDGTGWSKPKVIVEPGRWLWCVTWYRGKAYGVSYGGRDMPPYIQLLTSADGVNFRTHVSELFGKGWPTEVTLRFAGDGMCYALVRRDRHGDDPTSAVLGVSSPDYRQWNWHDLGSEFNSFGGPNFIQLPAGHWIGAGRMHQGGAHTAVTLLDMKNHKMKKLLKLPSGGDTSYPGLLWYNNTLYVSYYSSHEGKTSIYLAKLNVTAKCPHCGSAMTTVPMLVGLPTEEMTEKLKRGKALLAGCVGDPHNPEYACICLRCRKFKTARMKHWRTLAKESDIANAR